MTTEFQYPRVQIGTTVEVSRDHVNFAKPMLGWVINAKTRSADIVVPTPAGMRFIQAALHRDDPQVKMKPERFDPVKGYDNSGVFILADTEVRLRQIETDYRQLRTTLLAMQEAHRSLSDRLREVERAQQPVRRGPGRPPKSQPVEAVS